MKYILLPPMKNHNCQLPFYFAVEEYVARNCFDDDYFFIWQVDPTVMLGRNQLIQNEINEEYCKRHNVHVCRRKSGGGCIYSDKGCLQFSYITSERVVNNTFKEYISRVLDVIRSLGVDATTSGRNDIEVDGRKVAGAAFYRMDKRSILHNSLIFDTDIAEMSRCLTPSGEKLESKGVASVRQRVANLSEFTKVSIPELIAHTRKMLCGDGVLELTDKDMQEVFRIEATLAAPEFVYGHTPSYTKKCSLRLPNAGKIEAYVELKNDTILHINLLGDYFLTGDLDRDLLQHLRGVPFDREAVKQVLNGIDLGSIILNVNQEQFLHLLFGPRPHLAKPEWLKINLNAGQSWMNTKDVLNEHALHTICTSGRCPNKGECWRAGTATVMIAGDICTRCCHFCNTKTGRPLPLDPHEPQHVAESVKALNLKYVVITSVDRDDLPDLGANHWAQTINAVRELNPDVFIEVLIPDFQGKEELLDIVLNARPDVVAHNMETVARLTPAVRSAATYNRSLAVLKYVADKGFVTKTGIMVGLGETIHEVEETMDDLRRADCRILTIGQYLQPTLKHLDVKEYVTPQQFDAYKQTALQKGFAQVESGPLVRSSYHAERYLQNR
jgi:lipoyl synthase